MAAVLDRYGTGPLSFGATFWIPGAKTEKTAKKRRKNEQKWARYSHLKRVRVADLFVMDRYCDADLRASTHGLLGFWKFEEKSGEDCRNAKNGGPAGVLMGDVFRIQHGLECGGGH